jgi:activator of HSP90 ATPase
MKSPTRRHVIATGAMGLAGLSVRTLLAATPTGTSVPDGGVSHTADSIHQEPFIPAGRPRVYKALTDAKQFDKLTLLGAAIKTMPQKPGPAQLDGREGGAFSLFGGYITGRFIELVPNELVVQAWRTGSWGPGVYSITRFQLVELGNGTKIVFDHTGFPAGQAAHLATGWQDNYWGPLQKMSA